MFGQFFLTESYFCQFGIFILLLLKVVKKQIVENNLKQWKSNARVLNYLIKNDTRQIKECY